MEVFKITTEQKSNHSNRKYIFFIFDLFLIIIYLTAEITPFFALRMLLLLSTKRLIQDSICYEAHLYNLQSIHSMFLLLD